MRRKTIRSFASSRFGGVSNGATFYGFGRFEEQVPLGLLAGIVVVRMLIPINGRVWELLRLFDMNCIDVAFEIWTVKKAP